jgi:hypothetical protein
MSLHALTHHGPPALPVPHERRAAPRQRCILETLCRPVLSAKRERAPALMEDISTGGLRLVMRRFFEPGHVLAVSWHYPLDGPKHTFLAQVVYALSQGEGNWVVGCVLLNPLQPEEIKALL